MAARPNHPLDSIRALQHKLYRAAKRSPNRRFHALYDRVHRRDILRRAWLEVRANQGAPGVDAITIADIEASGVEEFLDELEARLRDVPTAHSRCGESGYPSRASRTSSERSGSRTCATGLSSKR